MGTAHLVEGPQVGPVVHIGRVYLVATPMSEKSKNNMSNRSGKDKMILGLKDLDKLTLISVSLLHFMFLSKNEIKIK